MSGLTHISKYLNEIQAELEKYELDLTKKAEEVSAQIKLIQEKLSNLKVSEFYYSWSEDKEDYPLSLGLYWNGSKVLFNFEDEAEVALGSNRQTRIELGKHLEFFLQKGIETLKEKRESLN